MKSLGYLNKYFIKYKWRFILGILFTVLTNYFNVKMPLFVQSTLDSFKSVKIDSLQGALWFSAKVAMIYIALSLTKGFFLFLMRQTIIIMSRLIEFDLKNEIFKQYERLDFSFYKRNRTGDLMNRISEDVSQVRMYLGPGIMYSINLIVMSIMVVNAMVNINGFLTFMALLPLPIMSFMIYKVSSKMGKYSKHVQESQSNLTSIAQETFAGIRIFKAHNKEHIVEDKFEEASSTYKERTLKLAFVNAFFMPTILFLIGMSTLLSIYIGGLMFYSGKVTEGEIVALILFVNQLTWPFASIGWVTSIIQRAGASQKRINEFLNEKTSIQTDTVIPIEFQGKIEFKHVSYTYPDTGIKAIDQLSFILEPHQTIAVLGKTGAGKSTLLALILRQIDPDQGEILIDDVPLKNIDLKAFYQHIGIIPQDVFLFSDTIKNNISFGLQDEVSQSVIETYAKKAHVHHNIIEFPEGYDTLLGERGVNLSGGQKQRISIARALIKQPNLLLIDDCLSAVDTETEEIILNNFKDLDCSSIIVSHRISTIRNANFILYLEGGKKKEEGTHETLYQLKGEYYQLYKSQSES